MTFIDGSDGWKLPFNFAIGLHILLIFSAIYLPKFLDKKPIFPDIYTIDLINLAEPQNATEISPENSSPPPEPPPKKLPEVKIPAKEAVPIADPSTPVEVKPTVTKPISIKPLKRKKKRPNVANTIIKPKKDLEQIHKKHLNEVKEAERLAQEAARLAASEAVSHLRQMLQETNTFEQSEPAPSSTPVTQPPRRTANSAIESQYFAAISNKLHTHWSLPEYKAWDPDLVAIVVIQIENNGTISKQFFERNSSDRLFDQFVLKTLLDASPLPPIPAALPEDRIELGFRFRPGSIQF